MFNTQKLTARHLVSVFFKRYTKRFWKFATYPKITVGAKFFWDLPFRYVVVDSELAFSLENNCKYKATALKREISKKRSYLKFNLGSPHLEIPAVLRSVIKILVKLSSMYFLIRQYQEGLQIRTSIPPVVLKLPALSSWFWDFSCSFFPSLHLSICLCILQHHIFW